MSKSCRQLNTDYCRCHGLYASITGKLDAVSRHISFKLILGVSFSTNPYRSLGQFIVMFIVIFFFQFDPINPSAPPILINGPATCLQMGPQMLGPSPLYSPALSGAPGILHMASGGPLGSSIPFQLGSSGGLVVASTMVAGTVTTNSVSACISSPSVSTATKGGKVSLSLSIM